MSKISERLSQLFKSSSEAKIAHDFLRQKLGETPSWVDGNPVGASTAFRSTEPEPECLRAWCAEWLSSEQLRVLSQVLRMASQHQRVYKRTVMLSPRAHLLVKTLAELEGANMSDVIERHLNRVLSDSHGLLLRTIINERTGQVDHDVMAAAADGE